MGTYKSDIALLELVEAIVDSDGSRVSRLLSSSPHPIQISRVSYTVFARKYRPQTFDEVVGQDHIVRTLKNAIEQNRLAQAYLFVHDHSTIRCCKLHHHHNAHCIYCGQRDIFAAFDLDSPS